MEQKKNQLQLNSEFVVRNEDINEDGILVVRKILAEITALYDQAIIIAFGDLNFYQVLTSSYHLDFINKAYPGDLIRLESVADISFGSTLRIDILVSKTSKKDKDVARGHFVFAMQNKVAACEATYLN